MSTTSWETEGIGESPFAEGPYAEGPYAEGPYAEAAFGEGPFGEYEGEGPFGEGPFGEGPFGEGPFGEGEGVSDEGQFGGEAYYAGEMSYNGSGEAFSDGAGEGTHGEAFFAEGPFGEASMLESQRRRTDQFDPSPCNAPVGPACTIDVNFPGKAWKHKARPGRTTTGVVEPEDFARAEVRQLFLRDFEIDGYTLRPAHRAALHALASELAAKVRSRQYTAPGRVLIYGEASSTGQAAHNLQLSEHRAFNTSAAFCCLLRNEGIDAAFPIRWAAMGEERSDRMTGDNKEDEAFRGVAVRVFAPIADCAPQTPCQKCPEPGVGKPPVSTSTTTPTPRSTSLCVSVPRIAPRQSRKVSPDIIPLGSIIRGLPLPVAIVTRAHAVVRVDDTASRMSGLFDYRGWGLEIALPPSGRAHVDIRASLRATLETIVRASAHLSARLRIPPFGLQIKVDASAFAILFVKLAAELRIHIDVAIGPSMPEVTACRPISAASASGAFDLRSLAGPATLIVPGRGLGVSQLRFASPAVAGGVVRLARNPVAVPADKATVRTLLILAGTLQAPRIQASGREAEALGADYESELFNEAEALAVG